MVTAIYVSNSLRQNHRLDVLADIISENSGSFPETQRLNRLPVPPDFVNMDTPFTTRFYLVTLSPDGTVESSDTAFITDMTDAEIAASAAAVLKKGKSRGWHGDFRYKLYEADGLRQIIFVSGRNHRSTTNDFMRSTVSIFGIGSLAVLVLIVILSRFAVRPAAESYRKQKEFITNANHELKTPLTLILTNVDIGLSIAQAIADRHKSSIRACKAADGVIGFDVRF